MMADVQSELQDCVDGVYGLFRQARPRDLAACTACCMPIELQRAMVRMSPRDWTEAQLQDWMAAAVADPLPEDVSQLVLPRVLDGLLRGEAVSPHGVEIALKRFDAGNPARWGDAARPLLDRFQRHFLVNAPEFGVTRLDSALCLFAQGGWNIDALFRQVLDMPDWGLIGWLHQNWVQDQDFDISAFWPDPSVPRAFYRGAALDTRLVQALERLDGADFDRALEVHDARAPM